MRLRISSAPSSDFSSGDDERVVAECRAPSAVRQMIEGHLAPVEVEAGHLGE
jgi:hypothetical protein